MSAQPTITHCLSITLLIFIIRMLTNVTISGEPLHQQQRSSNDKQEDSISILHAARNGGVQASCAASAGGYLLSAGASDNGLNLTDKLDATLANILSRNGPDMRPLRDFRDFDDISLDVAKRAWKLMRHHAQTFAIDRLNSLQPLVEHTLKAANVSNQCYAAAMKTISSAQNLDSWAIQLLNAWGNFPPTSLFEGTFGDIGSFHGCVNVPENPIFGHAHYCTIAYRPVMPKRDSYELIINAEPKELLSLFDKQHTSTIDSSKDVFSEILSHSQYNHYVYYKFGTCFPIGCSPRDVQRLAKLLGQNAILMSGPVKCHSRFSGDYEERLETAITGEQAANETVVITTSTALKISTRDLNNGVYIWKPHMTQTQWISMLIVGLISTIIVSFTLLDIVLNRLTHCRPEVGDSISTSSSKDRRDIRVQNGKIVATSWWISGTLDETSDTNNNNNNNSCGQAQIKCADQVNNYNKNVSSVMREQGHSYYELQPSKAISQSKNRVRKIAGSKNEIIDPDEMGQQGLLDENSNMESITDKSANTASVIEKKRSLIMELIDDCSIVSNMRQFFRISQNQLQEDILCINGIRCITMSWIIITHTMQYNDWSAFARIFEIETHLKSLANQPLFNGSYLVDSFFLVSGLLASFTSFKPKNRSKKCSDKTSDESGSQRGTKNCQQGRSSDTSNNTNEPHIDYTSNKLSFANFSTRSYLIGRYLRLTPQVVFISLLFILLPLLSKLGGPHWYTMTGEYSENCSRNWWLNLFYIQAFYRTNEMCNFVCWWISIDMFFHLFALVVILLILYYGHGAALLSCAILIVSHWIVQAFKHYQLSLPPNLLSTIPQTGAMWSQMTLESFWTPFAHAFPFFLGFYLGYLMATRQSLFTNWFTPKRALLGWIMMICSFIIQSYSTYFWVIGEWHYTRLVSTLFYLIGPIVWATNLSWIILACHYGYGSWINQVLSCKLFIILGKASYVVYLSHFIVLFSFFGSQNLLLEPTHLMMSYVIIGNITLSMFLGSFLCIVYEMPWLKIQKRLMKHVS